MAHTMQFEQVMSTYRQLLESNPGKALVIGSDAVAILENGSVFGAAIGLSGAPEVDCAYDFDPRSYIGDEGRWDGETPSQLQASITTPVFLDL